MHNTNFILDAAIMLLVIYICRSSNSPNKHFKQQIGLPHEYKPNIHELKQLFDDSKRPSSGRAAPFQRNYSDAKTSVVDTDLGNLSMRQRNAFNFEKAKQKFDNNVSRRNTSKSQSTNGEDIKNYPPSNIPKRTTLTSENVDPEHLLLSPYEDKLTRSSFSMTSSINLDSLKVSDDE